MTRKARIELTAFDVFMVRLFDRIDESNMAWIMAADAALREAFADSLIDLVPSYTTLMLHYDCLQLEHDEAIRRIASVLDRLEPASTGLGRRHEVPVWYDPSVGPELTRIAERAGIAVDDVVRLHCGREYQVFALGFAPGYGFMGLVEEVLATPRLKTPRQRVAAGSVGIADRQTAIYPLLSPGGWNILGRTALPLFEYARRGEPLLRPGDRVRFRAISREEFIEQGGDTTPLEAVS
ncbi:5-oxoprolinase subunit PxpB [Billgrantia sp. LNSP4103-1]|uniref:5-oxoprolinase subunit PxpB n=1 Tax=Billgrantia sp. LNSP4103-1 TaxID=3410266 RepID=UPI00403F7292